MQATAPTHSSARSAALVAPDDAESAYEAPRVDRVALEEGTLFTAVGAVSNRFQPD